MSLSYASDLSERVIGLAIDVHRHLGPGSLESAYEECLSFELNQSGLRHRRQVALPVIYKQVRLECGYRMDVVVEDELVVEVKATERITPVHEAQMLTYLRLGGFHVGLLMNFNSVTLKWVEAVRVMTISVLRVPRVSVVCCFIAAERLIELN